MRVDGIRSRVWFGKPRAAWARASSDAEWLRPEVDSLDCSGLGLASLVAQWERVCLSMPEDWANLE